MIWGHRHLGARRLAFRNDYCRTCKTVVRAERTRTFWFVTFILVPIVPLGIRRRWLCPACTFPVHATPAWGGARKLVLAVILALVAVAAWQASFEDADQHPIFYATFIGILSLAPILLTLSALRHRDDPSLDEGLRDVPPTEDERCPFCNAPLTRDGGRLKCRGCDVERLPSPQPSTITRR